MSMWKFGQQQLSQRIIVSSAAIHRSFLSHRQEKDPKKKGKGKNRIEKKQYPFFLSENESYTFVSSFLLSSSHLCA